MAQGPNEHAPGFCLTGCSSGTNLSRQLGADDPPALGASDSPAAGPAGRCAEPPAHAADPPAPAR
eukprot:9012917-Alexandrium_andersonii.AAC.1